MRFGFRIFLVFICVLFSVPDKLLAQSTSCIFADAGPDDSVCNGQCSLLASTVLGSRQTNVYSNFAIPYAPNSFTGGNPVLVNLDDVYSPIINIPFCFDFYGITYNQIVIGTNGVATFDITQANGTCPWTINVSAPNPGLPLNSIMAPFHDIDPTIVTASGNTSINWNVYGNAPCRTFVINWNDIGMYGNGCDSLTSTSQIVLHEGTNIIEIFIKDKSSCLTWNGGAAVEGLQDATGANAITVPGRNFPTVWGATNNGTQFIPAGAPNYTLQWTDPSNTVISNSQAILVCPTQTTTYAFEMTNTTCTGLPTTIIDSITVFVVPFSLVVNDTFILPTCPNACDGSITLFPSGGLPPYSYLWTPSTVTGSSASGLCAGIYSCVVTDGTGCSVLLNFNLQPPPLFQLSVITTPSICNDSTGTAALTITGGTAPFTMSWSNGDTTAFVSGLQAGIYYVIVTDSVNCPDTLPVVISNTSITTSIQSTQLLCNGDCNGTAIVTPTSGTGPYTYSWSPYGGSTATASSLCSGVFSCFVTDVYGCTANSTVVINSPGPIIVTPSANQTICLGQSTVISASVTGGTPPYTYVWNNSLPGIPSQTITPTQTTIYSVQVTDANGCVSAQQTTLVKINHAPVAGFSYSEPACPPVEIFFTNTTDSAVYYHWDFGDPTSGTNDTSSLISPSHIYNTGGTHLVTLIATNAYGCSDTLTLSNAAQIPLGPIAGASTNSTYLTSLDPVLILNNTSTNANQYLIYFGDGDSLLTSSQGPYSHSYDSLGVFSLTIIAWNSDGCIDTAYVTITIEDPTTLFVPNAFTPNGDGKNDLFMVSGYNVKELKLLIFNRWGELIFKSESINDGWDGTFKGDRVQEDVYVWKLIYTDNLGEIHNRIGHVSVIR